MCGRKGEKRNLKAEMGIKRRGKVFSVQFSGGEEGRSRGARPSEVCFALHGPSVESGGNLTVCEFFVRCSWSAQWGKLLF
jgi:hypothetical protein